MNQKLTLNKNAQIIQNFLEKNGLSFKVIELAESTRTATDAANAIGCTIEQICKSLIFKTKFTNKPILILASGTNFVKEKKIELIVGEEIIKADANFTREITGYTIGGIPPIAHKQIIDLIFVDEDILNFNEMWAAAGTPNAVFNINSKDLIRITNGKIISIK
jgi:prolyl-tRNA editing enzyme YbaK/EbsC (Cys-tRNA(Pro) deacylase)